MMVHMMLPRCTSCGGEGSQGTDAVKRARKQGRVDGRGEAAKGGREWGMRVSHQ